MRENKAWAIASGKAILIWSAEFTRKECVKEFEDHHGRKWADLKEMGYRVCKIRFYEVSQ